MDTNNKILVSGLINIETTVKIPDFPLEYTPIYYPFFGIDSTVSGVGVNISKALTTLGDDVNVISLIGNDINGKSIMDFLEDNKINTEYVKQYLEKTAQSVVLYEESGKRQVHCDLKDVQEKSYDEKIFQKAMNECSLLVLCNINFSRSFLKEAKEQGKIIATDVHVLGDIFDEYNSEFMRYANILFMSDESISESVEDFVKKIINEYDNDIIVVGLGNKGALLYVKEDNFIGVFDAVNTRKIVNTIGAGDSLFSAFIHYYNKTNDPYSSLKKAIVFASYKIGTAGASQGFLPENELETLYLKVISEN